MTKTLTEQIVHIKNEWIDEKCNIPYLIGKSNKDEQIERLQEQIDECEDALYEYIQIHGVERKCSKYLAKYAKRTK